jgi:glycosyltransferase involved in cell wall biosynthesis
MRYLLSLVEPLKQRGEHAHLLGNRNLALAVDEFTTCEPAFSLRCEEHPFIPGIDAASARGAQQVSRRRSQLFRADLDRIADRYALSRDDVLLINSLRHWSLKDFVEWLEERSAGQSPWAILVLHYTPFPHPGARDPAEEGYRQAFKRIANSKMIHRILLCTDSERLAADYRSLCDLAIHVVPIPHSPPLRCELEREPQPLLVGFAGEARPSKGFHLLPGVVRRLRAATPPDALSFAFQSYGASDEVLAALSPSDKVRLFSEPLGEEDYEAFVASIDLMLIPYMDSSYRAQTSGVFSEAMALGVPTIVPEDSWMADQLAVSGAGLTFRGGDEEDLARACMQAIDSYPALRARASEAAAAWRAYHNAENYCEAIIRLIDGPSV